MFTNVPVKLKKVSTVIVLYSVYALHLSLSYQVQTMFNLKRESLVRKNLKNFYI